ncbi:MAG: hypothetical protein IPJ01_10515 [Micavibrio sp.]|nr:hypothetical protein [Micavibrio sp.]
MSKNIDLAKKLKALADRGVDGEKTNAEAMLNSLMKKHNITIEEIEGEELLDFFFKIEKIDYKFLNQIIKHVNHTIKCYGEFPKDVIKKHNLRGNYMINCTSSEYIEIEAKYSFYKKLYEEEVDVFYTAFLTANSLLIDIPDREDKEMTLEDYENWKRVNEMSKKIKVGQFNKQLE